MREDESLDEERDRRGIEWRRNSLLVIMVAGCAATYVVNEVYIQTKRLGGTIIGRRYERVCHDDKHVFPHYERVR